MASRKSTNVSLFVLGLVSLGVIGYFVWLFLAPPPALSVVAPVISTDIQTGVVQTSGFQVLEPYANLPITATGVGRINPFEPFNANVSSTTGAGPSVNTPKAPLINEPAPPPAIKNTNTP